MRRLLALAAAGLLLGAAAPSMYRRLTTGSFTTANMAMTLPTPGVDVGPGWATMLNAAIGVIDGHNHAPGSGVRVPTAGLLINADVPFNNVNIIGAKSLNFSGVIAGTNLTLSSDGVDLWYQNLGGTLIQLTCAGAICVSTTGGFGGNYVSASALATYTSATQNYTFTTNGTVIAGAKVARLYAGVVSVSSGYTITNTDQTSVLLVNTSTLANSITLPAVASNVGRVLIVKDSTGAAATHHITVFPASGTIDGAASLSIASNWGLSRLTTDGTNWFTL